MSSYRGPSQSHSRTSSTSSRSRSSRGTPPPQLPPAPATYTEDQLDYLEEQNDKHVTQRHLVYALDHVVQVLRTRGIDLVYALDHVVQVLRTRGIEYGVMGGMSMILLGNQERTTTDVDVAVQVRTRDLLAAFAADNRDTPTAKHTCLNLLVVQANPVDLGSIFLALPRLLEAVLLACLCSQFAPMDRMSRHWRWRPI
ncbi:hypothetical protein QBC36DRAFT_382336 [Triangularia setosa]|uniref:Uncharacterized protein n=1 Tax=Triangularia setosa TaxID=2587417 RepID=A0AAN6VXZ4_9PEZI|nr:hypothetical protein QBC36DRAFT_382336 [Podospora setosa]